MIKLLRKIARRTIDSIHNTKSGIAGKYKKRCLAAMAEKQGTEGRAKYLFKISDTVKPVNFVCNGQIELLGYQFDLDNPMLWTYSPDSDSCWPREFYSDYNLLEMNVGDYKLIWELGRLQFLPGLLPEDAEYGKRILARFLWEVETLFSIHWFSEMEIAIRLITLMLILPQVKNDEIIFDRTQRSINIHYHFLKDNLTTHWKLHNNHLLVETIALMCYEMCFETKDKQQQKSLTEHWQLLENEISFQIFDDGGIGEQATSYTRFDLDAFLLLCKCCNLTGSEVPAWLRKTVYNMLDFLDAIKQPDNHWPMIGDGDDGRVIPPATANDFWDFRGHFTAAGKIFADNELLARGEQIPSDFDWLLAGDNEIPQDSTINTPGKTAKHFVQSGYWINKNASGDYLLLRAGNFGLGGDGFAPHSHCDEMSFVAFLSGEEIFTDCGTYTYEPRNNHWRKYFQSCCCHNVVEVDRRTQAEPKGNFSWGKNPQCSITDCNSETVSAEFTDYENLYSWQRKIAVTAGEIEIADNIKFNDNQDHQLKWYFNLAEFLEAEIHDDQISISSTNNNKKFSMIFNKDLTVELQDACISRGYGQMQDTYRLCFTASTTGSIETIWKISSTY